MFTQVALNVSDNLILRFGSSGFWTLSTAWGIPKL